MKIFKRILLLLAVFVTVIVIYNYPKLNILAGYSAKSTATSVFLGERSLAFTDKTDNNFSPVHLATDAIDPITKSATASVFGLLTRKAIIREGLGSVLTLSKADENSPYLTPKRTKNKNKAMPYPLGDGPQKDTVFTNVDYEKLNTVE